MKLKHEKYSIRSYSNIPMGLLLVFLICILFHQKAYASLDTTAPKITSFNVDKLTLNLGDSVHFDVGVFEEETGVSSLIVLYSNKNYSGYSFGNAESIFDEDNEENLSANPAYTGLVRRTATVEKRFPPGEYVLEKIIIGDSAGNCNTYGYYEDNSGPYLWSADNDDRINIPREFSTLIIRAC